MYASHAYYSNFVILSEFEHTTSHFYIVKWIGIPLSKHHKLNNRPM